jgi:hypothetical protein
MKRITSIFLLICVTAISSVFAQETGKFHFIIKQNSSGLTESELKDYLKNVDFDRYRFVDIRRDVKTDDGSVLELLSGKELLTLYGKQISPLNLTNVGNSDKLIVLMRRESNKPIIQRDKNQ